MKNDLIHLLLFLPLALLSFTAPAQDVKVDSILNLHFEKVGGMEAWKQLNSYILTQSAFQVSFSPRSITDYAQDDKVEEHPTVTYYKYPDKYQTEMFKDGKIGAILLLTESETKAYNLFGGGDPGSGITFPEERRQSLLNDRPFYTLGPTYYIVLKKAAKKMEYKGLVKAYGKDCHQLVFNNKEFKSKINLFFDAETYLIHAISDQEHPEWHKIYADYGNEDGIIIPHTISSNKEGKLIERFKTLEIKIDPVLDGNIFLRR